MEWILIVTRRALDSISYIATIFLLSFCHTITRVSNRRAKKRWGLRRDAISCITKEAWSIIKRLVPLWLIHNMTRRQRLIRDHPRRSLRTHRFSSLVFPILSRSIRSRPPSPGRRRRATSGHRGWQTPLSQRRNDRKVSHVSQRAPAQRTSSWPREPSRLMEGRD